MPLTDRLTRYFLARLRRQAIRVLYRRVALAGLIAPVPIDPAVKDFVTWCVTEGEQQLDNAPAIDIVIARALRADVPEAVRDRSRLYIDDDDDVRSGASLQVIKEVPLRALNGGADRRGEGRAPLYRKMLLKAIRKHLPPPSVAEVAVCLLVARAVGTSGKSLAQITSILRMPDPMILLRIAVPEFEDCFGAMLGAGLIIPRIIPQVDGFGNLSLSGSYRDRRDGPHMITFSGKSIRKRDDDIIRAQLAKARLGHNVPVVIADELATSLSSRFVVAADFVLGQGALDVELIAELMHICAQITPKISLRAMERKRLDPAPLGIDDLVVAIRPNRSAESIIQVLQELGKRNSEGDADDDDRDDKRGKSNGKKSKSKQSLSEATNASAGIELLNPAIGNSKAVDNRDTARIEDLDGYGDAKTWALDLKADLDAWRTKHIGWSEMSTRLLLAGPPGTGKTSFARALRNTLGLPLLATSAAQWLEPSYLGDVLSRMTAAFDAAQKAAPCILFIDEFDNVGKRGSHDDRHSNYWSSLVNRLLELLDGARRTEGVIVIGATNHPYAIDPALLRSGRLETRIDIALPDTDALAAILVHHLGDDLATVLASRPSRPASALEGQTSTSNHQRRDGNRCPISHPNELTGDNLGKTLT